MHIWLMLDLYMVQIVPLLKPKMLLINNKFTVLFLVLFKVFSKEWLLLVVFLRGQAGAAAAGAYTGAARQYGQAAAGVNAQQTQAAQTATNNALTTVNNMDAQAFQSNFGMTQQEAQTILNSGNSALATQLSDLINSSNFGTSQTLGVLGAAATNGLNNAYMANANQQNVFNSATNLGLQGIQAGYNYYNPAPASYNGNYNSLQGQGLASTPPQGSDYYSPL